MMKNVSRDAAKSFVRDGSFQLSFGYVFSIHALLTREKGSGSRNVILVVFAAYVFFLGVSKSEYRFDQLNFIVL